MGTGWEITIWDNLSEKLFEEIKKSVIEQSENFDKTYSRFIKSSLVWKIAEKAGVHEVPQDLTVMLKIYDDLYLPSDCKLNPLVGFTMNDLGYDENYSLKPKSSVQTVPDLKSSLKIMDETHIETAQKVLIDLGALGKGYFVDILHNFLKSKEIKRFLVNGSGDIRYHGNEPIAAGLEHPTDKNKVIGSIKMSGGALCASGTDRRKWDNYNHLIDPQSLNSPKEIVSTWVTAETAALADALATCLFLTNPDNFTVKYKFEYCLLDRFMRARRSPGFTAEFY